MMEIFEYDFMRRAFFVGLLLAVVIPCVGVVVVLRRLSMIGDALSHSSLAGVAAGLILGINPVVGAMITCVAAALGIEAIRRRLPRYAEMAIAIVMSAGIGLAGVLSGYAPGASSFHSFLFGSIVAISDLELWLVAGVSAAVLAVFLLMYRPLFYLAFSERAARLAGMPVKTANLVFTILTALTVAVAARTVGALIVSSLMVVPVAAAMQIARGYRRTILLSILLAILATGGGLFLSFYVGLRPGGAIVLLGVALFLLCAGVRRRPPATRF